MTFGVILTITNPLDAGYLAFIAAITAWSKIADKIVILDGGSDDGSVEEINRRFGKNEKIQIIQNETLHWGKNNNWHALQLGVNLNYGLDLIDTDWVYCFSTDYIPFNWNRSELDLLLNKYHDKIWVRTYVGKVEDGSIKHKYNNRNILFNNRKIKNEKKKVCYGLNYDEGPSDFPIIAKEQACFIDPETGVSKFVYRGEPIDTDICLDVECVAYGHFFYNLIQLENKLMRWDYAFSRFYGMAQSRLVHLKINQHIDSFNKNDVYLKDEILKWDHPTEIKELIREKYVKDMVGGIKPIRSKLIKKLFYIVGLAFKYERKIRTAYGKIFLGFESGQKSLKWHKI